MDIINAGVNLYNQLREQSYIFVGIDFDPPRSRYNRIIIDISTALPEAILLIPESYEGWKVIYRIKTFDNS